MNCSQLLERQPAANWGKSTSPLPDRGEDSLSPPDDSHRWSTVRSSFQGQRFAQWIAPSFKTSSS
jgi:hypothetical protein